MKNRLKSGFMAALMGSALFLTGCADTQSITPDETTKYDGKLVLTEGTTPTPVEIFIEDVKADQIKVLVTMTSTDKDLRRVYITKNVAGAGETPFSLPESDIIKNNGDGSMNLSAGKGPISFELTVPKNTNLTGGNEVYKIWATNGKGDYRDTTNSFVAGVGTVTITYGAANNPAAPVKAFTQTILAAPLANGTSKTFMSTIDGKTYSFTQADAETGKFWDLGYYYGATGHASLASAFNYPTDIVDVSAVSGIAPADLNKCYFKLSSKTSNDFDAISTQSDLQTASTATTSDAQRINMLSTSSIIEFVDGYGKKGMIRVVDFTKDSQGTYYGTGASITIDVKVQR